MNNIINVLIQCCDNTTTVKNHSLSIKNTDILSFALLHTTWMKLKLANTVNLT